MVAQGRPTEADIDWLHLLVADGQLIADLAFADIVLWIPTTEGSFIAVAHSRPSSAATLFYRDFVGQEIKPEWKNQVTEAFETAQIVDTAAPRSGKSPDAIIANRSLAHWLKVSS